MKLAKLKELTEKASREDIVKALKAAGYKLLGAGVFGEVYGSEKHNNVVKLGKRGKADSDGYVAFAQRVHAGQYGRDEGRARSPSLPKIFHFKRRSSWYVAVLEKLTPLEGETEAERNSLLLIVQGTAEAPKNLPRYATAAAELVRDISREGWSVDMHAGNFLMRGKTVVITDPLAFKQ